LEHTPTPAVYKELMHLEDQVYSFLSFFSTNLQRKLYVIGMSQLNHK